MSKFKWSQTAADDLQRIAEFIRATHPDLEQQVVGDIVDRAYMLRQHPRIGQRREKDSFGTELRALLAGKRYRVIYEVYLDDSVKISRY